jgi:hypothetical protein
MFRQFLAAEAITTQSQAVIREEIREDFTSLIREYIHTPGIKLETVVESLVKAAISRSTKWRCSDKSL